MKKDSHSSINIIHKINTSKKPKQGLSKILVNLIQKSLVKHEKKVLFSKKYYDDGRRPSVILREEFEKPIAINKKELKHYEEEKRRDVQKILINLKEIPGINRFLNFNCISFFALEKIAGVLKYKAFKKGDYIFRQGEKSDKFYGVLTGEIGIDVITYKKKNFYIKKQENRYSSIMSNPDEGLDNMTRTQIKHEVYLTPVEEEKTSLGPGMCFGEWGLIYNIPRTASAKCKVDSEVFYLEKEFFSLFLEKDILKADLEKKNFVTRKIPALLRMGKTHEVLSGIVPCVSSNI